MIISRNNGNDDDEIVDHHPWESTFRNGADVINKWQKKKLRKCEHRAWHTWIDSHISSNNFKKKHPSETFKELIDCCSGKKICSEEESKLIYAMVGFDWKQRPTAAIISIFEKFMPLELYCLAEPYYSI